MPKVKGEIEFPEDILISLKESKEEFLKTVRLYAAAELYRRKKLSLGKAAELVDMGRLEFADFFYQNKIPVIDLDPQELEREIRGAGKRTGKCY